MKQVVYLPYRLNCQLFHPLRPNIIKITQKNQHFSYNSFTLREDVSRLKQCFFITRTGTLRSTVSHGKLTTIFDVLRKVFVNRPTGSATQLVVSNIRLFSRVHSPRARREESVLSGYIFQRYSGFCNMQMRCLMTSSTPHRVNKLPQMSNISSNSCAHWNVPFVLAQLQSFRKIYHYFRRYSSFTELVEWMTS